MAFNIYSIMKELSELRPLFHNELDLQFNFAMLLKEKGFEVRLEHYIGIENYRRNYIDLVAFRDDECYLFEFKYKTINKKLVVNNETFDFFNHGARDLGSYAVLSDVERLEKHSKSIFYGLRPSNGYVIFLTNDFSYMKGFKTDSLCFNYGLTNNKTFPINDPIQFNIPGDKTKEHTCVKSLKEIKFIKEHKLIWSDYNKYLKMLIIEI